MIKLEPYLRSLIKNHPLADGNKRIGLTTTESFLLINNYVFDATQEERIRFAIYVAASEPAVTVREVSAWIKAHSISQPRLLENARSGLEDPRLLRMAELVTNLWDVIDHLP